MKNMDEKNWRKRFKYRVDLSSRVTHLTKGETAEEAFRNLINILEERRIRGSKTSSGFICGETPAVPNSKYYKKFVKYCLDKNREDILLKIRGIVVIASVYF